VKPEPARPARAGKAAKTERPAKPDKTGKSDTDGQAEKGGLISSFLKKFLPGQDAAPKKK